jgi:hypothetical protein
VLVCYSSATDDLKIQIPTHGMQHRRRLSDHQLNAGKAARSCYKLSLAELLSLLLRHGTATTLLLHRIGQTQRPPVSTTINIKLIAAKP